MRRVFSVVLALTLIAAACGTSDGREGASAATPTTPSTTTSSTRAPATTTTEPAGVSVGTIITRVQTLLDEQFDEMSDAPPGVLGPPLIVCEEASRMVHRGDVFACQGIPHTSPDLILDPVGQVYLVLNDCGDVAVLSGTDMPSTTPGMLIGLYDRTEEDLLCRDLFDEDVPHPFGACCTTGRNSYFGALTYWFMDGRPERMDADGDGVPCEALFDAADVAWVWSGAELADVPDTDSGFASSTATQVPPWINPVDGGPFLGSGCTPGSDQLPDGVWLAWSWPAGNGIEFDLACFSVTEAGPEISSSTQRLRTIDVASNAAIYPYVVNEDLAGVGARAAVDFTTWTSLPINPDCDTGGPPGCPYWLYVNDGVVTEMVQIWHPSGWDLIEAPAWTAESCCATSPTAPASPPAPFPAEGLPTDGVYAVTTARDPQKPGTVTLEISRWLPCRDHPEHCLPDAGPDDVYADDTDMITRTVTLDENLTVVVRVVPVVLGGPPWITWHPAIGGTGTAFAALLENIDTTWDHLVLDPLRDGASLELAQQALAQVALDPTSQIVMSAGYGPSRGPVAFRGPRESSLVILPELFTQWIDRALPRGYNDFYEWWTVLEIENGNPILYVDAGRIAG